MTDQRAVRAEPGVVGRDLAAAGRQLTILQPMVSSDAPMATRPVEEDDQQPGMRAPAAPACQLSIVTRVR